MKSNTSVIRTSVAAAVLLLASCTKEGGSYHSAGSDATAQSKTVQLAAKKNIKVFKSWGDSSEIVDQLNAFRAEIGAVLNTAPGATGGRREINWDGVPASFTNNNLFPGNFFAAVDPALPNGRKRGITFINFSGFRISDNNFADIDPTYAEEFKAFSPNKTFMSVYSNFTEIQFKVPGTNTQAFVEGFGVIFTDVERGNSATIELFNENFESLGVFMAHPQTGKGKFSFLGIKLPGVKIAKVVIKSGEVPLGDKDISNGGMFDLVVMDDFLYSEPVALD